MCAATLDLTPADKIALGPPLYHCFGSVIGSLAAVSAGSALILPSPVFDPQAYLRAIATERATAAYGVPTMMLAALEDPSFGSWDVTSLRTGVIAGTSVPEDLMQRIMHQMYMKEVWVCVCVWVGGWGGTFSWIFSLCLMAN